MKLSKAGTLQLYDHLKPKLKEHGIKMGRDKLHQLLKDNGLMMRRKKKKPKTTNSYHKFRKHPDLLNQVELKEPEQFFVSDITYIKVNTGYSYLALVTDAYTKKIMGHYLSRNMKTRSVLKAMRMAHKNRIYPTHKLTHHSDRGFQYCDYTYTGYLTSKNIGISMTQDSSPYDNSVAERVNGILKDEFGIGAGFVTHKQAVKEINNAIDVYNDYRTHGSIERMTPNNAHKNPIFKLKTYKKNKNKKLT